MDIVWTAPGGGLWELETMHVQGGQPRIFQERAPRASANGFRSAAARYGLPIENLEMRFVNDHCYARICPVGAPGPKPGKPSSAPPAVVLWLLARLHPELRRRARAARRAIEQKVWHEGRLRWEQHDRPAMLAANRALQREDLEHLDDDGLADHVRRAAANMEHGIATHMALIPVQDVTVGRLLLACRQWSIADADTIALLGGSSPASMASAAGLGAIAQACRVGGVEPVTLAHIRAAGPEAAAALDRYLADHGWRAVTQYSPRGVCLVELPHLLVEAIRAAAADLEPPPAIDPAPLRARVPEGEQARFDDLLADARACFGVRDDNVALTFLWPCGLVRRALLEAGRRLAARELLWEDWHVFGLGEDEVVAALGGNETLAEVAAGRAKERIAAESQGAPPQLGDDEGPPPDPGLFPSAMAELLRSIMVGFELEQAMLGAPKDVATWSGAGVGVGSTPYTGRACVVASAEDALERLRAGDVLVTTLTTPTFEAIMPIAGAVVTEVGGLVGHTALVCREYGIPAVVGVTGATTHIVDGAPLTVDPSSGRVLVDGAPTSNP